MSDIPARPRQVRANKIDLSRAAETPTEQIIHRAIKTPVQITDATGRSLKVKYLGLVDHMRITRVLGPELSKNERYMALATLAFCVTEMDGEPLPQLIKPSEVEFMVDRLGEEGAQAIGKAYADAGWSKAPEESGFDLDAAKN